MRLFSVVEGEDMELAHCGVSTCKFCGINVKLHNPFNQSFIHSTQSYCFPAVFHITVKFSSHILDAISSLLKTNFSNHIFKTVPLIFYNRTANQEH